MAASGLLSVGRITKPHGLKGELILVLSTNRTERAAVGTVLTTASGRLLTISFSAAHQDRWRVRFEGVADRNAAELLHGTEVFAAPIDDPDALWIHELIGAAVTLTDGSPVGTVASVESAGASDLLILNDGRMIPLVFVVTHERDSSGTFVVVVDPPVGLLDDTEAV
jgi:16S rRNA processing protein RimM